MLLRRITRHVKEQNWFAVGIDFVIVVIGVFIGLQVANWNEARVTAQSDAARTAAVLDDLIAIKTSIVAEEEIFLRTHAGWVRVFRALEACEPIEQDEEIAIAFARFQSSSNLIVPQSAFDEMEDYGSFSRLDDPDLRRDVAELYALLSSISGGYASGRANQLASAQTLLEHIPFSFSSDEPYNEGFDTWGTAEFDTLQFCQNLVVRGAVWEMVDVNRDWLTDSRTIVNSIDDVIFRLTKHIEPAS